MLRWKRAVTAVAVVMAMALSGCAGGGQGSDQDGTPARGGTLTLGSATSPPTFDPAGAGGSNAPFYQAVYDSLLSGKADGEVEPFLATTWEYDETRTQLTLELRDDVTFIDDSALTAGVVKTNLERFRDGTAADRSQLRHVASIDTPDEHTVVIHLAEPDPALLVSLSGPAGAIASGEALTDVEALATNPVGSGPYVIDTSATVIGTTYAFTKNDDYWNPDLQYYDRLVIRVLADPTAQLNAIKAGEVNALRLLNNDSLAEVEASGWSITGREGDFQGLLLLDREGTLIEPLGDVRVRQAINYAFDRESLLQVLQGGNGTVTEQVFPPTSVAFDPALDKTYPFDPERARELLAEAGYPDGFSLTIPTNPAFGNTLYTLISQQLGDIGITVQLVDAGTNHTADVVQGKYGIAYHSLGQFPVDAALVEFLISPTATFNPFHTTDPVLEPLIVDVQTGDEATRDDAAVEINKFVVDQAWFAPWYRRQLSVAHDANTAVDLDTVMFLPGLYDFSPAS